MSRLGAEHWRLGFIESKVTQFVHTGMFILNVFLGYLQFNCIRINNKYYLMSLLDFGNYTSNYLDVGNTFYKLN